MESKGTFNSIANEYEKYRPTYPKEMYNDIFDYSNLIREDQILEIGCGTGQATGGLVEKGYRHITCIEYGDRLAQFTAEKFKSYGSVKVINSSFEEWNGEGSPFKLAISGTAFHFIEPKFGYRKVWELLESSGSIAFFWTIHVPMFDELHNEIQSHYKELAPHLDDSTLQTPEETINERRAITEETGIFTKIMVREYSQILTYSSNDYISLLNTNSKHRSFPKNKRIFY